MLNPMFQQETNKIYRNAKQVVIEGDLRSKVEVIYEMRDGIVVKRLGPDVAEDAVRCHERSDVLHVTTVAKQSDVHLDDSKITFVVPPGTAIEWRRTGHGSVVVEMDLERMRMSVRQRSLAVGGVACAFGIISALLSRRLVGRRLDWRH